MHVHKRRHRPRRSRPRRGAIDPRAAGAERTGNLGRGIGDASNRSWTWWASPTPVRSARTVAPLVCPDGAGRIDRGGRRAFGRSCEGRRCTLGPRGMQRRGPVFRGRPVRDLPHRGLSRRTRVRRRSRRARSRPAPRRARVPRPHGARRATASLRSPHESRLLRCVLHRRRATTGFQGRVRRARVRAEQPTVFSVLRPRRRVRPRSDGRDRVSSSRSHQALSRRPSTLSTSASCSP